MTEIFVNEYFKDTFEEIAILTKLSLRNVQRFRNDSKENGGGGVVI